MGGTSYDVAVVRHGAAPAEPTWNWHHRCMVAVPMVKVETLGAGGGSICHVASGTLQVGPESAGADPGPVCYGRGGDRPTVTDANLVLGLLSDASDFAGGSFRLTRKGVDEAFEKHVAGPMGTSVEQAAFDCWRVVNANMTQAVRRTTAGKGIDPRELTLLAYGGNGPVFAGIQAQDLGITRVLVPKASPTFSALGALTAQPAIDEERSYLSPARSADPARLKQLWLELDEHAEQFFLDARYERKDITALYELSLRYPGQNWSLTVEIAKVKGPRDLSFVNDAMLGDAIDKFHTAHEDEYGHRRESEEPEITGVRLATSVEIPRPTFRAGFTAPRRAAEPARTRRANLGDGFADTPIFAGPSLEPGHTVTGPAIIEETFTTIVVYPGWRACLDDAGDYELTRA
jgi:N-methylhydantoinase A